VFEYPNYTQRLSYPFELTAACTTSLQDEIVKAAERGFCPAASDHQCRFHFVASCFLHPQVSVPRHRDFQFCSSFNHFLQLTRIQR